MPSRPRIGVLGGSFNPLHLGHLVIASVACAQMGLERLLFVPAARPPHKQVADDVPADTRLRLTHAGIGNDARFAVSAVEIEQGLVYTRDVLAAVAAEHPGHDLVFVMGSDSLLQFGRWRDPASIARHALLAVAPRPGDERDLVAAAAAAWAPRLELLDAPALDISSTDVRRRVREGLPVRYLVPEPVERLIGELGLYGGA
jgi:nicotinate-nucleotide adenylyltransferase